MLQCPKCKSKRGIFGCLGWRLFKKTESGKYFCVKCNAEVKLKTNYKVIIPLICVGLGVGFIGDFLIGQGIGGIGGGIIGITGGAVGAGLFTKVELTSEKTSPNNG